MSIATTVEPGNGVGLMTPETLAAALRRGEPLAVLDVRRRATWTQDSARVPGAAWVPLEEVPERARGLPSGAHLVDIAGSTRLLVNQPPETAPRVVQRFMRLVTEVALAYCGDVKDFEGDGASSTSSPRPRRPRRPSRSGPRWRRGAAGRPRSPPG